MCVCAHMCGAGFTAPASSLVGGAQQDNQVLGGAWCWWSMRVAFGQAAEPWRSREEEDENSRGSVLPWQMVKFCCGQICSGMSLSLFPLESPVFPGSRIGISVPQMCKNQQFSSWHGRLSRAVPLGQWQGLASILPPHPVSPPHLCAQCTLA